MRSETVGIVAPVHNRPEWIGATLESIQNQTMERFVCVVVDDGSTDHTASVIRAFERKDRRFVLLERNQSGGPSIARNDGVAWLRTHVGVQWLAFCDSDDTWAPGKLECQLAALAESGGNVVHAQERWIRNGAPLAPLPKHKKPQGRIFLACLPLCCVSPSAIMMRASFFEAVGGFDPELWVCEDYDLWLRLFARVDAVLCNAVLVTKNGGHGDQLSSRFIGMDRFRVYALLKAYRDLWSFLSAEEQRGLVEMIKTKSEIVRKGYAKHGRMEEAETFQSVLSTIETQRLDNSSQLDVLMAKVKQTFPKGPTACHLAPSSLVNLQ